LTNLNCPPGYARFNSPALWEVGLSGLILLLFSPVSMLGLNGIQYAEAPEGLRTVVAALFFLGMAALLGWAVLCLGLPVLILCELAQKRRWHVIVLATVATIFVYGSFRLGQALYNHQREAGLARIRIRAQPLIAALEAYRTKMGTYPATLTVLTPTYLPSLPSTGTAVFREFQYRRADGGTLFKSYELSVPTPKGMLSFDRYLFWPERKYPALYHRNGLEPIGDWAFMHE
jgi:hypothetical protein